MRLKKCKQGYFDGALMVIAGSVADVKAACEELRSAAGGEAVGESHLAVCVPAKVCSSSFSIFFLFHISSDRSILVQGHRCGDHVKVRTTCTGVPSSIGWFSFWEWKHSPHLNHPAYSFSLLFPFLYSQLPRVITLSEDSEMRHVLPLEFAGWLLGEYNAKKKACLFCATYKTSKRK